MRHMLQVYTGAQDRALVLRVAVYLERAEAAVRTDVLRLRVRGQQGCGGPGGRPRCMQARWSASALLGTPSAPVARQLLAPRADCKAMMEGAPAGEDRRPTSGASGRWIAARTRGPAAAGTPVSEPNVRGLGYQELRSALRSGRGLERQVVAGAMRVLETSEAADLLTEVLLDRRAPPAVRAACAYSLGFTAQPGAAGPLSEVALGDASPLVRASAALALGFLDAPGAEDALVVVLRDRTAPPRARANAAESLGHISARAAIPQLIEALSDPSPLVRAWACWALAAVKAREALPALRALALSDRRRAWERVSVSRAAADAVALLER